MNIPRVEMGFTNTNGEHFDNIRNIIYGDGIFTLGKRLYVPSEYTDNFSGDDRTYYDVEIYQSVFDEDKAFRLYSSMNEYKFNGNRDDRLISRLLERQPNVKKTKFPTGIITRNGLIIGQETYFIEGVSLFEYVLENDWREIDLLPSEIYLKVIEIMKELYDNGIYYFDGHAKNYIVNKNQVNLIDFDNSYLDFHTNNDRINNYCLKRSFEVYRELVKVINELWGIKHLVGECKARNYDEAYEEIDVMTKKLRREK